MKSKTKKKILVVEDDLDIRELIAEILSEEGYQVSTAENGQLGLEYLIKCSSNDLPDCIILDLMMPVMSGMQVLENLHLHYAHDLAKIPVIIATAKGTPKDEPLNMPANVLKIRKPMDVSELIYSVAKHSERVDCITN